MPELTASGTVSDAGLNLNAAQSSTPGHRSESSPKFATAAKSSFLPARLEIPAGTKGASSDIKITLSQSSAQPLLPGRAKTESRSEIDIGSNHTESFASDTGDSGIHRSTL